MKLAAKLQDFDSRDLAATYIGTVRMLDDLNAVTLRLPGGISGRIETAHLHLMRIEQVMTELAKLDPEKMIDICDYLDLSQSRGIRARAEEWRTAARRDPSSN